MGMCLGEFQADATNPTANIAECGATRHIFPREGYKNWD
jgi:hypothetical protein